MTTECEHLTIKTGSHGVFHMQYTDDKDEPINLFEYEIYMDFIHPKTRLPLSRCRLREGIEILDINEGTYYVDAGDTSDWPLGEMPVDIKYIHNGRAQHTETFILNIVKGITQTNTDTYYVEPDPVEDPIDNSTLPPPNIVPKPTPKVPPKYYKECDPNPDCASEEEETS